ncbi:uracil-DNA glycosylase [Candidimonas humi]|uniref:uracil-DNA glycosylase n=1 Tax=Candidimonas humi TaxID=683355 RepID=A0ABV8NY56_9BURK|nr:uracil-DNA glycosylase [Candidimonas humi]MBV6305187.1 uracil-DNA glycosylase [Candidimonas humi]
MLEPAGPQAPSLNRVQLAWLQELGLDRALLKAYVRRPAPPAAGLDAAAVPAADGVAAGAIVGRGVPAGPAGAAGMAGASAPSASASAAGAALVSTPGSGRAPLVKDSAVAGAAAVGGRAEQRGEAARPAGAAAPVVVAREWGALQAQVETCEACGLCEKRRQAVFGAGAVQAPRWLVVGEAPGEQDDRHGEPFQGRAGTLLQAMLRAAGVVPDQPVYYTNIVKCRPVGNRTPKPDEIQACLPYLRRQISLLAPAGIVALGRLAAQALLDTEADFESLRGEVHRLRKEDGGEVPLVVTYHPALLLSRPQHKGGAWQDLNLLRAVLA